MATFSPKTAHKPLISSQFEAAPPPKRTRWLDSWEWDILALSTAVKFLLFPAYRSTDFEVHRNWLAITHSLPISKWYFEDTSEWTLDYPPFFAYFEWALSIPAAFVDPKIVDVKNLLYDAWTAVAYQRITVILTELVLGAALLKLSRGAVDRSTHRIIAASLFLHPSFIIVDHIHFQYNGFMFGILLWSLCMAKTGNKLACGVLFAILLNFKHIYMYLAPAYFVYLLRSYCMAPQGRFLVAPFVTLASAVVLVFVVSVGPFAIMGQLPQLLSRLFPFKRGLNHAYWAPNAWALVTALDRVLLKLGGASMAVNEAGVVSSSRGLIGDTVFAVLPNIKPIHTFLITIAFQAIYLTKLWRVPTAKSFLAALTLCGYTSYMFGWHVHEKAVMLILVPLSLIAAENYAHYRTFVIASVAGIYSLFPLLFTPAESFFKVVYSLIWGAVVFGSLSKRIFEYPSTLPSVIVHRLEDLYLYGFFPLHALVTFLPLVAGPRSGPRSEEASQAGSASSQFEFLPLMLTSVYCAVGLVWAFLRLSVLYLRNY
ncbi:glycosyltransferase family 57 protein [Botryobasidium botryosum FD-172 SS1]|uniref:Alpha-1,3-glucosyltransferase n=1 Tax=Botryobasidium botryosum (strain FD-172 SS1) TaxID=930990 RepID=A0A067N284_BOTB1|nr:glycosyltransferase family 57 protein [Botryobasidium botryosum FD-172 SS1]